MDKNLTCQECGKKAVYREKGGELCCQKCHNKGKEVSYKTYTGNDLITNTTYIKCPHCGMGDTCGTDGCYVYKRCRCGILTAGGFCLECKEVIDSEKAERKSKEQADKCNKYLEELEKIDKSDITVKDYRKIKNLKSKVDNLLKEEIENESLITHIDNHLKKPLEELENRVPQQVLFKVKQIDNKGWEAVKNCQHSNICWRELFQKDEAESVYCLDCGEDESTNFTKSFQKWYCKKIEEWLDSKGLKQWKFTKFLKSKDYYDNWQDLKRGKFFEKIKDEFLVFRDMSEYIEEYCLEFAEEESINIPDNNNTHIRHREREREQNISQQSQLLSQIHQLESNPTTNQSELNSKKQQLKDLQSKEKTLTKSLPLDTQISILEREIKELSNKTSKSKEEETLLVSKKKELEELLKKQSGSNTNNTKPSGRTGLYIGLGIIGVVLIVLVVILFRKSKKRIKKH